MPVISIMAKHDLPETTQLARDIDPMSGFDVGPVSMMLAQHPTSVGSIVFAGYNMIYLSNLSVFNLFSLNPYR